MEQIFQIDSDLIKKFRKNDLNFIIRYNNDFINTNNCVIYFSSNGIYFPNNKESFEKSIVKGNYYEFIHHPPLNAYKQIFIRDINKQWYLNGINEEINTPQKLFMFLQKETIGYDVITIGSSAGGYAATLYGCQLNAKRVYVFNPQFEILSLLRNSNPRIDPLIFKYKDNNTILKYYDLRNFINETPIYYFLSENSVGDYEQYLHIKQFNSITTIHILSSFHGVPVPSKLLSLVFNLPKEKLYSFSSKKYTPLAFSIEIAGALNGTFALIQDYYKRTRRKIKRILKTKLKI